MSKNEEAVSSFCDGFLCSQAILSVYGEEEGLERELALKLATGLGGGMGRTAHTCGAVTGAILVIGLKKGPVSVNDVAAKEETYYLVREFLNRFQKDNGSVVCRELLECDIGTPDGYRQACEDKLFEKICPRLVESAVEILEEMKKQ